MARLFVSNFGFEDEIAGRDLSRTAAAATRGLNGCWAAMLKPTDLVCAEPYTQPRSVVANATTAWAIVPWGWSRQMVRWASSVSSVVNWPDPVVVEMLNRRRWGFAREKEIGQIPRGSDVVESVAACINLLSEPSPTGMGWVVKADLGASGRGHRRIDTCEIPDQFVAWVSSRLKQDGMVQVEPLLPAVRANKFSGLVDESWGQFRKPVSHVTAGVPVANFRDSVCDDYVCGSFGKSRELPHQNRVLSEHGLLHWDRLGV